MPVLETDLADYLAEIRNSVCSRCVERPPNGPPCGPLGKVCGVEMHLAALVDSIQHVHTNLLGPYQEHDRKAICDKCAYLHSSICPCPMDYLAELIVEAVEKVDQRRQRKPDDFDSFQDTLPGLKEMQKAYFEGTGTWHGCDWSTQFGKTGLDLRGMRSVEADIRAENNRGTAVGEDWIAAARWLFLVEEHARQAEERAAAAVRAAAVGHWREALEEAKHAANLEFATGRAVWRFPLAWLKLLEVATSAYRVHRRDVQQLELPIAAAG